MIRKSKKEINDKFQDKESPNKHREVFLMSYIYTRAYSLSFIHIYIYSLSIVSYLITIQIIFRFVFFSFSACGNG